MITCCRRHRALEHHAGACGDITTSGDQPDAGALREAAAGAAARALRAATECAEGSTAQTVLDEDVPALSNALAAALEQLVETTRERDAAIREADRLRHNAPIEGDWVCPDALRADAAVALATLRAEVVASAMAPQAWGSFCMAWERELAAVGDEERAALRRMHDKIAAIRTAERELAALRAAAERLDDAYLDADHYPAPVRAMVDAARRR